MEFTLGQRVILSRNGVDRFNPRRRYDPYNPVEEVGTIITLDTGYLALSIRVRWENGKTNIYHTSHLTPIILEVTPLENWL